MRARAAALALLAVEVAAFFLPWARMQAPAGFFGGLGGGGGGEGGAPYATLGLVRCLDGPLCKAFNKMYDGATTGGGSDSVPPWLKDTFSRDFEESDVHHASVTAVALLASSICFLLLVQGLWLRDIDLPFRDLDGRKLLLALASALGAAAAIAYVCIIRDQIHDGSFKVGVYLTLGAGLLCLCYSVVALCAKEHEPDMPQGLTQGFHFGKQGYGAVGQVPPPFHGERAQA